jgi:predicted phage terminase large subunit-like protein
MTNKEVRIRRLGTYLAQRLLRFKNRSPGTALLVQQMMDFPVGDHDDGPDALEMALWLMIDLWNGRMEQTNRVTHLRA